jgi:hypothetical protein
MTIWKVTGVSPMPEGEYVPVVGGESLIQEFGQHADWTLRAQPFKKTWQFGLDNQPSYKVRRHGAEATTGQLFSRLPNKTVNFIADEFSGDLFEIWYNCDRRAMRFKYLKSTGKPDSVRTVGETFNGATIADIIRAYFEEPDRVLYFTTKSGPVELLPSAILALVMWCGFITYGHNSAEGQLHDGLLLLKRNGIVPTSQAVGVMRGMTEQYVRNITDEINKLAAG